MACALGINHDTSISWDKYDLLSPEGIRREVKSSGYIQTWEQEKLSSIIFGIQKTHGWNSETNEYDPEPKRQADIYVFCLHKHIDQETINPLDLTQWEFYVVATMVLDEICGDQKSISLKNLREIGAEASKNEDLRDKIIASYDI